MRFFSQPAYMIHQVAYYCNRDCQKADWSDGHKVECKEQQEAHKLFPWKERWAADLKEKIASQEKKKASK